MKKPSTIGQQSLNLYRIRLELAREPGHPAGAHSIGYELVLPLDETGRLDAEQWRHNRSVCSIRRFREGAPDRFGVLSRKPGGAWFFDYDRDTADDDEAGFRFGDEQFVLGEYVSVRDDEGHMHTYRVTEVEPD